MRARHLAKVADVAGAMTVEATKSSQRPFDAAHPGRSARTPARSPARPTCAGCWPTAKSCSRTRTARKVQDAYSMRCMPQVHGTLRDALAHGYAGSSNAR